MGFSISSCYYKDHYVAKLEADVESVKTAMIVVNMSILDVSVFQILFYF